MRSRTHSTAQLLATSPANAPPPAHAIGNRHYRTVMALIEIGEIVGSITIVICWFPGIGSREIQDKKVVFIARPDSAYVALRIQRDLECSLFRHNSMRDQFSAGPQARARLSVFGNASVF